MNRLPLRIFRSFKAKYYEDDILKGPDAYPESYFEELVENGFNAVWLRGTLRDLAATDVFPSLGSEQARHQDALNCVIERAASHGVKVLLYLCEPLGLPADHPFWENNRHVRGIGGVSGMDEWPRTYALCTSTPKVQEWMRQAMERLFAAAPQLGGWFVITASEHHTHCHSHKGWGIPDGLDQTCPRCEQRTPSEVTAEVITCLRDGTRRVSKDAWTIAWNWAWISHIEPDPQPGILSRLPKDVVVMGDFERGGWKTFRDGRRILVDEYSLSYVGPSERFMALRTEAQKNGLRFMAKLQIGTTHELATVPNLPLVDHVYAKMVKAEDLDLAGVLTTWNFGNAFSFNTAVLGWMSRTNARPDPRSAVAQLAREYFPGADADNVADAVEKFTRAMDDFPFDTPLIYNGPLNWALAYPLTLDPLKGTSTGWSWMMHARGDDFNSSLYQFPLPEMIQRLTAVVNGWKEGVVTLERALAGCRHEHARLELGVAKVIGCCYRSAINVYRVYGLRRDRPADAEAQFMEIVRDEIETLSAALPWIRSDSRLGFHAECQGYQFSEELVVRKLGSLKRLTKNAR